MGLGLLFVMVSAASPAMPRAAVAKARAFERRANELQRAGHYADAEKPLSDAIALWSTYRGPDDIEVLNDTINLAVAYRRLGEAERAVPLLQSVAQRLDQCTDPDAPELRRKAMNNLAMAYRHAQRPSDARATWEVLLQVLPETPVSEERARVLDNLAGLLSDGDELDTAQRYAQAGFDSWLQLHGADDLDAAIARATLGKLALRRGELELARQHLLAALEVEEKRLGRSHPEVAATLNLYALLEVQSGHRASARSTYQRALDIARRRLAPNHPTTLDALAGLRSLESDLDAGAPSTKP